MPSRANPYFVGNTNTYGSRSLSPGYSGRSYGGASIATPLAELASGLIGAAAYDPATDLNRQNALKVGAELQRQKDMDLVRSQQAAVMNDPTVSLADIASSLVGYGRMPAEDAAKDIQLARAARGLGPDQTMDDALTEGALWEVAAGKTSGSTFPSTTFKERMAPTEVIENGAPVLRPAQDSYGAAPVLSKDKVTGTMLSALAADNLLSTEDRKQSVGARVPQETPYNYLRTDPVTGQVVESGSSTRPPSGAGVTVYTGQVQPDNVGGLTTGVKSDVQKSNLSLQNFRNLIGVARTLSADPTVFGAAGNVRRFAQDAQQQIQNIGLLVGSKSTDLDGIYRDAIADAAAKGVDVSLLGGYDPNLSDIVKVSTLLRYAGASALAGQAGRSVSDADVRQFKGVAGDPTEWTSTQQKYVGGLDLMDSIATSMEGTNASALGGAARPAAPAAPAPAQDYDFEYVPGRGMVKVR
jgi:hypothetical protein